jgi:hypothetical protein
MIVVLALLFDEMPHQLPAAGDEALPLLFVSPPMVSS